MPTMQRNRSHGDYWRFRAEESRTVAAQTRDQAARASFEAAAASCDSLASLLDRLHQPETGTKKPRW